jgi:hypothetical protein
VAVSGFASHTERLRQPNGKQNRFDCPSPDEIRSVLAVPRTPNGKKVEVPVKKILGAAPERAVSRDTLANPGALDAFLALAEELAAR